MFSAELAFRTVKLDEAAIRAARHILHVDASHGATSVIAHGAQVLFAALSSSSPELQVDHLRLWDETVRTKMEYNLQHVRSKMAMLAKSAADTDVQRFSQIEELAAQVASARGLVVSAPMWNYGVPWVLKQYFDCVLHPGLTFKETASGPKGAFCGGRPLVVITSSGGEAAKDHLTPWLLDVASMMGFDRPLVVSAPNVAHDDRQLVLDGIAKNAEKAALHLGGQLLAGPAAAPAAPVGPAAADREEEGMAEWGPESLLRWLRAQGGLSQDALETLEVMGLDAQMFQAAPEEDWSRNEELDLKDPDVVRIVELQRAFLAAAAAAAARP